MSRRKKHHTRNANPKHRPLQLAASDNVKLTKKNTLQIMNTIVPKATSRLRMDVAEWKNALEMAENPEMQRMHALHNLYKQVKMDARLTSQIQNRKLKSVAARFNIKTESGEVDEELTREMSKSNFFHQVIANIWDKITDGHTLLEFNFTDRYTCSLIPRQNVIPYEGVVLKDYTDDKGVNYREAREFGNWLIEFGTWDDLGLINKAVPHVIFKRFAQTCWSELCEIYGIPPRVMKTNAADPSALTRAEQMMTDMGAAAWFIIDDTEEIDFATATTTNGEVYQNIINLCNNEISMLMSGVIVGQDTKYGSKSKEDTSIDILDDLVEADKRMIEQVMQDVAMPAMYMIGFMPAGKVFEFDKSTDIDTLWTRTKEILPYKNVDDEWLKEKFGVEVTGDRQMGQQLAAPDTGFFY